MYHAHQDRYHILPYAKAGQSGLVLPKLSLGCWHNFGDNTERTQQKNILYTAFDQGINHFDLANNYGTPYGSAEQNIGYFLQHDFKGYRDELIISTKAGWDMWPGPYGQGGSGRKYLIASLNQSLKRLNLDYVDIFYSHRYDENTPLEETAQTLADIVKQGKALYIGISSGYSAELTQQLIHLLQQHRVPLTLHQPQYNFFQREIEQDLLLHAQKLGVGVITFSPLAQGLLSGRYQLGIPNNSRVAKGSQYLTEQHIQPKRIQQIQALKAIADERGQTLAQLALAWVLRHDAITSTIIGASHPDQIKENVAYLNHAQFSTAELQQIDDIFK